MINVMKERLWNCFQKNESERDSQPDVICNPVFDSVLDGEKHYKGNY